MAQDAPQDWITWAGGVSPVGGNVRVETVTRGFGKSGIRYADNVDWKHRPISRLDVIAYRVVAA